MVERSSYDALSFVLMTLRDATSDDAADLVAIYTPIVETTTISFETVAPTVDEMRSRIEKSLATHAWLVSVDDAGHVDGYVYGGRHREREAYQWSVDVTAYVRADARGRGIAKALYVALFERLAARGYYQAFAGIALPNEASIALHESVGFVSLGTYRKVGFKLGAWRDVGWWQKQLREPTAGVAPPVPPLPN